MFGPVGFLIYIDDLQSLLDITKHVDDGTVWEVCDKQGRDSLLQLVADQSSNWCVNNLMKVNCDKSKELLVDFTRNCFAFPSIHIRTPTYSVSAEPSSWLSLYHRTCRGRYMWTVYTAMQRGVSVLSHPAGGLGSYHLTVWQRYWHNHCQVCRGVRLSGVAYGFNR